MKMFILPFLLLMATAAMAEEDFLGTSDPDEPAVEEKPKWEDNKWTSGKTGWRVLDFIGCSLDTMAYFDNGMYDQGFRGIDINVWPLKSHKPTLVVGHVSYLQFDIGETVTGSIGFNQDEPKKVKFKVNEYNNNEEDRRALTIENFNLNILRSMASSETMEIKVNGASDVTLPLDGMPEAYDALAECFKRVKERGTE